VAWDITIWYQSSIGGKVKAVWVALYGLLVVRDITIWYQSHGFNIDHGWAMLVNVEAKVSENNCCKNGQNSSSKPQDQVLTLDGLDKWSS
jgi:hypothetical protein